MYMIKTYTYAQILYTYIHIKHNFKNVYVSQTEMLSIINIIEVERGGEQVMYYWGSLFFSRKKCKTKLKDTKMIEISCKRKGKFPSAFWKSTEMN
jgi:hypothetical protein